MRTIPLHINPTLFSKEAHSRNLTKLQLKKTTKVIKKTVTSRYHNGYFRNRNLAETNNNNVNNNNRNNVEEEGAQAAEEEQPLVGEEPAGAAPDAAEAAPRTERSAPEASAAPTAAQNPGTSVMSIIKTFVITFITSLLPDTQTL